MKSILLTLEELSLTLNGRLVLNNVNLKIREGELLVLTGPSGSGKTLLGRILAGHPVPFSGKLTQTRSVSKTFISQQHTFRYLASTRSYYQQRFEPQVSDDSPTVKKILSEVSLGNDLVSAALAEKLSIAHVMESKVSALSNGEGKRLQLALALLNEPGMLVLDNPFTGLDKGSRQLLLEILRSLHLAGKTLVLISAPEDLGSLPARIVRINKGKLTEDGREVLELSESTFPDARPDTEKLSQLIRFQDVEHHTTAELIDVRVKYGEKVVLDGISWKIQKGERWALSGPNGSGKSTLLSLINGDNPQAYRNNIILFDKPRGSGESIWEIRRKIGYVSPELHLYFGRSPGYTASVSVARGEIQPENVSQTKLSCFDAVASGYHDQSGSAFRITSLQEKQVRIWLEILGISHLGKESLFSCSLGEQRLVLLARALVKDPPLLILDEPCQGLDRYQTKLFKEVINGIFKQSDKTLIYVSHYPADIPECVDKYFRLENGKQI